MCLECLVVTIGLVVGEREIKRQSMYSTPSPLSKVNKRCSEFTAAKVRAHLFFRFQAEVRRPLRSRGAPAPQAF